MSSPPERRHTDIGASLPASLALPADRDGFAAAVGRYRRELEIHCYRMLGSPDERLSGRTAIVVGASRGLGRRLTPLTELGRPAVQAYATRAGQPEEEFLQQLGEPLTPEAAGVALVELIQADPIDVAPAYLLTGAGLETLS